MIHSDLKIINLFSWDTSVLMQDLRNVYPELASRRDNKTERSSSGD